ncbi:rod shape-determining protein MreC [Thiospirillum jenense]|uniref:Cell shape-determining protein MreC n=1 Tax=Thiospirillum jenense TaxID=1653858 RepID=A0A839HE17_9GAMM|nr:rod shape-determining protein MreC [Thiospirillum jenense]MBB1127123.1 rod shape-determining protein MreC [Thiospirillum jenense]
MKPLFNRGTSATARLALTVPLSLSLLVADLHYPQLDLLRSTLSVVVFPLYYLAALPARLGETLEGRLADEKQLRLNNAQLHNDNLILQAQLQKYAALEAENQRLRNLLGSAFKVGERVLIAELLEVDLDPYRQQVLVDKGENAGVFIGQPVLDAQAVMGQVIRTNPLTATVLLITDAAHSLPVQVNRNGLRAIATGTGIINQLNLLHLPKKADIRPGDLLVTSGLGGVFPPGYPVARVTEVRAESGERFATVIAEPTARLERSHEVLLVWSAPSTSPSLLPDTNTPAVSSTNPPAATTTTP